LNPVITSMTSLSKDDPLAIAAVGAIHEGRVEDLARLLADNRTLVTVRIGGSRTLLHIATDWPGHFPRSGESVVALVAAGADVNAPSGGRHPEMPLHWAASSSDMAALDALLDRGADIEAEGFAGGGTALADAVKFGQWKAAWRLIERGAKTTLWQAAALGLIDRMEPFFAGHEQPPADDVTNAFWCACHGGQRAAAEYLLHRGADLNWIGHDELTPLDTAIRSEAHELAAWLRTQGAKSTAELR
jgi:ankyrin repeat protein